MEKNTCREFCLFKKVTYLCKHIDDLKGSDMHSVGILFCFA